MMLSFLLVCLSLIMLILLVLLGILIYFGIIKNITIEEIIKLLKLLIKKRGLIAANLVGLIVIVIALKEPALYSCPQENQVFTFILGVCILICCALHLLAKIISLLKRCDKCDF